MEILRLVLLYIHLIGFAMLFGGWLTAYLSGRLKVNVPMLAGTATQVISGVILSAPIRPEGEEPDPVKLMVKALLGIVLAIMVWIPHLKKRESSSKGHFLVIGGLTLVTVAVAVFWQ